MNVSQELRWLEKNCNVLKGIQRGIERETLRVDVDGFIAKTNHPKKLGSPLTHKWITTDFAEALLEFITPVHEDIDHMMTVMFDIHRYTARVLCNERMWPLSMPCYIKREKEIKLAQYGISNIGRLKTLYREGLKNRYGALMQIISGVHYNFSLPTSFWNAKYGKVDKDTISAGYLCLIRNYYRFGWIIPYLFGASPGIYCSFLQGKSTSIKFEKTDCGIYYLPYATSLRLSKLGYSNKLHGNYGIIVNELREYVSKLKWAIKTPSTKYKKIGLEKDGKRLQINNNVLQIEDELYAQIRPKCMLKNKETLSDALLLSGIKYIEIRSLDINPFSPIGIDKQQVLFLDLFMIWCILVNAPQINNDDLLCINTNWNRVILEGRRPGLTLCIGCKNVQYSLLDIGKYLFKDLTYLAQIFDFIYGGNEYQHVCVELVKYFDDPELTLSARILGRMIENGIAGIGNLLATKYHKSLQSESLEILTDTDFAIECEESIIRQYEIESSDTESFSMFLKKYN